MPASTTYLFENFKEYSLPRTAFGSSASSSTVFLLTISVVGCDVSRLKIHSNCAHCDNHHDSGYCDPGFLSFQKLSWFCSQIISLIVAPQKDILFLFFSLLPLRPEAHSSLMMSLFCPVRPWLISHISLAYSWYFLYV